jgi:hypothetical protein
MDSVAMSEDASSAQDAERFRLSIGGKVMSRATTWIVILMLVLSAIVILVHFIVGVILHSVFPGRAELKNINSGGYFFSSHGRG